MGILEQQGSRGYFQSAAYGPRRAHVGNADFPCIDVDGFMVIAVSTGDER
jgi:hypothetical protein